MQLTKCENGHIYNMEKFRSCPHCSRLEPVDRLTSDTYGHNQADVETAIAEESVKGEVGVIIEKRVVGMLIVTAGEMKGAGFLLKEGSNSIGRSSNMDVALISEPTVSRKQHAVIEYADDRYVIKVMDKDRNVYVDGKLIIRSEELSDRAVIGLGDCSLTLIEAGSIWKE